MPAAQRTAWDAYLTVTGGLLPAVGGEPIRGATIGCELRGFVVRIERYAPLWGADGPMLLAAVRAAQALHQRGDRTALADLLRAMADRLYLISARPSPSRCEPRARGRGLRNEGVYGTAPPHRRGEAHG
ncbi:hypothetical protein [Dactylosporangium sp. NPDC050588]|uniref:hypothetical protein n=1 Tax=Dactylosporangium sp. NPDC050588 TaxID=3157211 RepID=UPI0033FAB10C